MGKRELFDVFGIIKHQTEKSWLVDAGLKEPVWLPFSQVEFEPKTGRTDRGTFTMPVWMATEKGLM